MTGTGNVVNRFPDVLDVLERVLSEDPALSFVERYRAHRFLAALRSSRRAASR